MNSPPATTGSTKPLRRALVTGSSGGIGEAAARRLAASGFAVAVHGRREDQVHRVVDEIAKQGGTAVPILGDLTSAGATAAIAAQAADALGGIDIVVNNAGLTLLASLEESSLDSVRKLFEVNLFAVMALNNRLLPAMRERGYGRVINISSVVGWLPTPYMGAYSATKHALEAYSEILDHEVRNFGIRVCTVQPGFTRTSIKNHADKIGQPIEHYDSIRPRMVEWIGDQIDKGVDPDTVARVIVLAATTRFPRSHYVVGAGPTMLRTLRSFVPARLFALGLRKHLRLDE